MRWHSGVLAWALWALAMLGIATIPWFDHLLRQARQPELLADLVDADWAARRQAAPAASRSW
jgi:hypothetical protein